MWNCGFSQTQWLAEQAQINWDETGGSTWLDYAAMLATKLALIWDDRFGAAAAHRVDNVLGTQTANAWIADHLLTAPLWQSKDPSGCVAPASVFDSLAVTTYFAASTMADATRDGGAGDDTYITDGHDVISKAENAGTNTVKTSVSLTFATNLEHLRLTGTAANNVLNGGTGADSLIGGKRKDPLYGRADASIDVFIFQSLSNSSIGSTNRDVISDFMSGIDDISLSAIDANTALVGNQAFTFNGTTAKAHAVWYVDIGSDVLICGDINGDTIADFEIQVAAINAFRVADFIL